MGERDGVRVLTLDRPPANAFDPQFVADLRRALAGGAGARALVFASANARLFSAGWDLPKLIALERNEMRDFLESYCDLIRETFTLPVPVVAALPGHAIAGGLIFAASADERLAAQGEGRFGLSEVALGVPLPACLLEIFRYVLGDRGMERLAATGENVTGERALAMGLLDGIVPSADLLDRAVERAATLAKGAPAAHAAIKRRARGEALARFDAARKDDPFLDFWFAPEARERIRALVEKLSGKK